MTQALVCLLSGGLDSTVALALALRDLPEGGRARALTADYGQRAAPREIAAAEQIAAALSVPHTVVDLRWLSDLTETALCRPEVPLPRPDLDRLDADAARETAAQVWVPNRNGVLLNVAGAYAEALGPDAAVVVGFNREEAQTFPDNSREFMAQVSAAFELSTRGGVRVASPTAAWNKDEIVRQGREVGAPLEHVWVCYEGSDEHCLTCESCRRFERALDRAGADAWWQAARRAARETAGPADPASARPEEGLRTHGA